MARLTKLEREALTGAALEVLAGDAIAFFNGGVEREPGGRMSREERADFRKAQRLARALDTAVGKIAG